MATLFAEIEIAIQPKHGAHVAGDLVEVLRRPEATYVFLADGLKSGIHANLSAQFVVTRLRTKLESGASLVSSLEDVLDTLEENRRRLSLWTALTAVQISALGFATIYGYEMPAPLALSRRQVHTIPSEPLALGGTIVSRYCVELQEADGLLLVSDGVTQAGVGSGLAWGWGIENVRREAEFFAASNSLRRLPDLIVRRAAELSSSDQSDDASAVLILMRRARRVTVLTGPPSSPQQDGEIVQRFLSSPGAKIVCGGTTAGIVARYLGTEALVDPRSVHPYCPPRLVLEGVDLATEGAICLNQLSNLLDFSPAVLKERNVVVELYELMMGADEITFLVGNSENPASNSQPFFQTGVLPRQHIVPVIAEKLRAKGKVVTVEWI